MKYAVLSIIMLPLVSMIFFARFFWSTLLGLLAGFGMAIARDGNSADTDRSNTVKCYVKVQHSWLSGTPWKNIPEMERWAEAEQFLLNYLNEGRTEFAELEPWIKKAEDAAMAAGELAAANRINLEAYRLTRDVLVAWHRDLALSHTSVLCYEEAPSNPTINDTTKQLRMLGDLFEEGKLDDRANEEAHKAILQAMRKGYSESTASEASQLLLALLGFN